MIKLQSVSDFFFQAEDGIRDTSVTGVQTCALPISFQPHRYSRTRDLLPEFAPALAGADLLFLTDIYRSEERRVGKEYKYRRWSDRYDNKMPDKELTVTDPPTMTSVSAYLQERIHKH